MDLDTFLSDLNPQQKEAVLIEDKRVLVIAGAGSGKTKTLIKKIVYLNKYRDIPSSNILAITFTRNAANEMIDRYISYFDPDYIDLISDKNKTEKEKEKLRYAYINKYPQVKKTDIKTFHSLGYKILEKHLARKRDDRFSIIQGEAPLDNEEVGTAASESKDDLMRETLFRLLRDPKYTYSFKRYLWDHVLTFLAKFRYEKGKSYLTLQGNIVDSYSKRDIANWLTEHRISFLYNNQLCENEGGYSINYDFYLPEFDIYIEIYDKKNELFLNTKKQKISFYNDNNKKFIKIDFWETYQERFLALERRLKKEFFDLTTNPSFLEERDQEALESDIAQYKDAFERVLDEFELILEKIKSHNISIEEVKQKAAQEEPNRTQNFYGLFIPFYQEYHILLKQKGYLDYNDLMIQSIELLSNHEDIRNYYKAKYKYILVDEYQDVNNLQVDLIRLLLTDDTQLICVGDDWQSIYGFRGSNVKHIIDFEKVFPGSKVIKLLVNYRSGDAIVNYSSQVIQKNKNFIEKEVKALNKSIQKITMHVGENLEASLQYTLLIYEKLLNEHKYQPDDILFLYRRTKDFDDYKNMLKSKDLKYNAKTIHSAKGLEAKVVFLIMNDAFPTIYDEKRIVEMILPTNVDDRMDEERRVYYVSLTRAKERLFILAINNRQSQFLEELPLQEGGFLEKDEYELYQADEPKVVSCVSCGKGINNSYNFCPFCYS